MAPTDSHLRVLVVDDNETFVSSLVAALRANDILATGCSEPWEVLSWRKKEDLAFDLILLDMRLGLSPNGEVLNAMKLLPHLMTYAPSSKVVTFSQQDITVEECIRCVQLGALTVVPKSTDVNELSLVTQVYQDIGDQRQTREQLIQVLWEHVTGPKDPRSGQHLEMLVINLFDSMPTFRVVGHNLETNVGEIDVLVENVNESPFWRTLNSVQLVVECRNRGRSAAPADFDHLKELVKTRGAFSRTGILIAMAPVSSNFRRRQSEVRSADSEGINIFRLDRGHLETLIATSFDERADYLQDAFERQ
jgi:ActR/RegA family two-component response regulator